MYLCMYKSETLIKYIVSYRIVSYRYKIRIQISDITRVAIFVLIIRSMINLYVYSVTDEVVMETTFE